MSLRSNRVDGLAESYSLLGRLPDAARDQVGVEMARIGYEVLAAQKRDVAKDTRALEAGLGLELQLQELRMRIGLLSFKSGRTRLYYGRFVEFGRRRRVVNVVRGTTDSRAYSAKKRRARKLTLRKPYDMKVPFMRARPFIYKDRPELRPEQRLANFWSEVLNKAGSAQ